MFPQSFLEDLKNQTNIVSVIGEVVSLKKTGGTYKGLCPFHQEKTPSFNVNPDKGFFKCFGCGAGGDVLKFVELHQKLPFPEAVRYLAARAGIQVPEAEGGPEDRAASALREALLKVHEQAAAFYTEQLASPAGAWRGGNSSSAGSVQKLLRRSATDTRLRPAATASTPISPTRRSRTKS